MTIGELFVTLGFKADTVKVKDFARAIGDIPLQVAGSIAALAGLEFSLTKIAQNAMNAAVGFQMFTSQTGLSWQELQRWQIVAQQANVSTDAVASSVTALQRNLAEISLGRGNISPFQLLGISANQDAFGVLRDLRARIQGLNPALATNLISQMGLDPSMIQVLRLSNTEFDRLAHTVRGMSGDQEGSFLRAKETITQFTLQMKYLGFDVVSRLITGLSNVASWIKTIKLWIPGLVIAFGAIAAAIFPITAAVVGLLLVLDDLAVYFKGGKSITGEGIEGLKKIAKELADALPSMKALQQVMSMGVAAATMVPQSVTSSIAGLAGRITAPMTQNTTINVHSTAPAHEVAHEVKKHLDRAHSNAATQSNQQGY